MINRDRDIFVLFKDEYITDQQVAALSNLLRTVETPLVFAAAHELVDRNRISTNKKRILRESSHYRLRAFRFLIGKN